MSPHGPPLLSRATWHAFFGKLGKGLVKHRVLGLSAEVAFYALFSFPPVVLALSGAIGYIGDALGPDVTSQVEKQILALARAALTHETVNRVIAPTLSATLREGRVDIISIGVLITLWSGSRAASTLLDALNVVYNVDDRVTLFRRQARALVYTLVGIFVIGLILPVLVVGPGLLRLLFTPLGLEAAVTRTIDSAFWPIITVSVFLIMTVTYYFSSPFRRSFVKEMPGALVALGLWLLGSVALRAYARWIVESSAVYGALASPMVFLLWLQFASIGVLVGAEINSVAEDLWPTMSRREKKAVLRKVVDEMRAHGEEVSPVSVTGGTGQTK